MADFKLLIEQINEETPRGQVLISAALLDEQLRKAIEARLIAHSDVLKLTDGFNAPLGSFSARILAAFALGVVSDDEYRDLEIIRKVRNDFAHSMTASFTNSAIKDRCALLKFAIPDYGTVKLSARDQFVTAAVGLALNLVNRATYVSRRRLRAEAWEY